MVALTLTITGARRSNMTKRKAPVPSNKLVILVNGSIHTINTHKIDDDHYRLALSNGIAQLIHEGKLKLDDIK